MQRANLKILNQSQFSGIVDQTLPHPLMCSEDFAVRVIVMYSPSLTRTPPSLMKTDMRGTPLYNVKPHSRNFQEFKRREIEIYHDIPINNKRWLQKNMSFEQHGVCPYAPAARATMCHGSRTAETNRKVTRLGKCRSQTPELLNSSQKC